MNIYAVKVYYNPGNCHTSIVHMILMITAMPLKQPYVAVVTAQSVFWDRVDPMKCFNLRSNFPPCTLIFIERKLHIFSELEKPQVECLQRFIM